MTETRQAASILWTPAISEPEGGRGAPPYPIWLSQRVLREVQKRISSGDPADGLGLLLGEVGGTGETESAYVRVDRLLPSVDPVPEDAGPEAVVRVLRPLLEAATLADKTVAGWYRAHARLGPALSEAEERLHGRWFPEPWQFAFIGVADPARPGGAVFARSPSGRLVPVPFRELVESSSLRAEGGKSSALTWRNYGTEEAVERPAEPVAPAASDADAGPGWRRDDWTIEPDRDSGPAPQTAGTGSPTPSERGPEPHDRYPPSRQPYPAPYDPYAPSYDRYPPPYDRYPPYDPYGLSYRRHPPQREPGSSLAASRVRRRGEMASEPPHLVLPDFAPADDSADRGGRLVAVAAILLLAAAGWMLWQPWTPGGRGAAASPEPPDAIEFAAPASEVRASEGEAATAAREDVAAAREDAGTATGEALENATSSRAAETPSPTALASSTPAPPLGVLADRVFASAEAYERARREFDRGRADCQELQANQERVTDAFGALRERFVGLLDRVEPAAETEFRRAAARTEEVERHLAALDCPPAR